MSTPFSQPVIPPQPNLEVFGVQSLALFKTYTRDSFRSVFGVEPPAWDPSRPAKSWFDSTVDFANPTGLVSYRIAKVDNSSGSLGNMVVTTQEAAAVNLQGAVTYPPYVVPPTMATRGGANLNPLYFSLEADARALMAIVGGSDLFDEGNTPVFPVVYPPDELRRTWDILFKGNPISAGLLLLSRNRNGVGSPGQWDTSGSGPVWVPAAPTPTGLDDTRPPRPMPVRDLLPNEKFQAGLMGVSIVRIDLQQQANQESGQFTPDDRATLQQIYQILSRASQTK